MKANLLLFLIAFLSASTLPGQNSVLSTGQWFKISVSESGIHKIDRELLEQMGIDTESIDPRNLALYGYGGGMLPQSNSESRISDLPENAIMIVGEEDGSFNSDDYLLFYGETSDLARYDEQGMLAYQNNLYSDLTYYFLTVKSEAGKRLTSLVNEGSDHPEISIFDDFIYLEEDETNLIGAGREWYGNRFSATNSSYQLSWDIEGIVSSNPLRVTSAVMSQSFGASSFDLSLNGTSIGSQFMEPIPDGTYDIKGFEREDMIEVSANGLGNIGQGLELGYQFNRASTGSSTGFLNYVTIEYQRQLALYDNETIFRSLDSRSNAFSTFEIQQVSGNAFVWDITDPTNALLQEYTLDNGLLKFGAATSELREFIIFEGDDFPAPSFVETVDNQNLTSITVPDGLIITIEGLLPQAQRLADFRLSNDGLEVEVVTTNQIFNEFSSGRQDVAALRDFIRHLYLKDEKLKYVLLFGDASYDYKGRVTGTDTNLVPIYEARNSLHPIFSYGSDDFFGFMEENEGEWQENDFGDHTMEIGIGRLPVINLDEAEEVVNKIISYATGTNTLGSWRNEIFFVADDGDFNIHQRDADRLASFVDEEFSAFNPNKIYLDAFPQVPLANGRQSAEGVSEAINEAIDNGALIFNFTGHGNENLWCDERILDQAQIREWNNQNRLPLFVTATCEFGRYDDPSLVSGGELLLLSERGGAIALLTTTRPVFSNTNFLLNRAFYNHVFEKENDEFQRLGDIFRKTKNESLRGPVNRNFALLGDPMTMLTYPQYRINITELNGQELQSEGDTISALGLTEFRGIITDQTGAPQNNFTGTLSIKAFDIPNEVVTLGNESNPTIFEQRENLIFNGEASIRNGEFSFRFVVPVNISYLFQRGKVSLYAQSDNLADANGANIDLRIGGTDQNAPDDNTPPEIDLFLNSEDFSSGDETGPNPLLIANVFDDNGINISNLGIGQNITATLDDELNFNLNDFYISNLDSYQEGTIRFPMNDLEEGEHTLSLKLFDTHGNSSERAINFFVSEDAKNAIFNVINYPNPLRDRTTISFSHNRIGEELDIEVEIYNLKGDLIKILNTLLFDNTGTIDQLTWDRTNSFGSRVEPGIYITRITLKTAESVSLAHQKLIVID